MSGIREKCYHPCGRSPTPHKPYCGIKPKQTECRPIPTEAHPGVNRPMIPELSVRDSIVKRPLIPILSGHVFQWISTSDSDVIRPDFGSSRNAGRKARKGGRIPGIHIHRYVLRESRFPTASTNGVRYLRAKRCRLTSAACRTDRRRYTGTALTARIARITFVCIFRSAMMGPP
jgi:hypothetical protein